MINLWGWVALAGAFYLGGGAGFWLAYRLHSFAARHLDDPR
jgi:hypothetical protein